MAQCPLLKIRSEPAAKQSTHEGQALNKGGGGQNLKLSTKAAAFERVSLLIGGGGQACRWGG